MTTYAPPCSTCGAQGRHVVSTGKNPLTWRIACAEHVHDYAWSWPVITSPGRSTINMTGKRSGQWEAVSRLPRRPGDCGAYWTCRCVDCGATRDILGFNLRQGHVKYHCTGRLGNRNPNFKRKGERQ